MQRTGNGISPAVLRAVQKERRRGSFHVNIYAFIVPHVARGSGETQGMALSANSTNPRRDPSAELHRGSPAEVLRGLPACWVLAVAHTGCSGGRRGSLLPCPLSLSLWLSCWWLARGALRCPTCCIFRYCLRWEGRRATLCR